MTETVECNYCGEVFESDENRSATIKEGVHRAEEHVDKEDEVASKDYKENKSIIEDYKSNTDEDKQDRGKSKGLLDEYREGVEAEKA